jgi:uncharacterized membrane protein (UPF0127 family)
MKVIINDNVFKVKVCMTPETIKNGMMGQRFDENFNGMLFMMPDEQQQSFWMKNCLIPLDIIFIDNNKKITSISKDCSPCNEKSCPSYEGFGNYILEVEGGTCDLCDIKEGMDIKISL